MRYIDAIYLHCSATPEGRDFTVEDIRGWHVKERGWSDIGFHFVIYRDGTVAEGRPLEKIGAHVTNYNAHSIGICYVGGVDAVTKKAKDTRTWEQKESLFYLCFEMMERFNLGLEDIHCHNEVAKKECPSFKIADFRREYLKWYEKNAELLG